MKPALHFIWSPLAFSITGFGMACGIVHVVPEDKDFHRFVFFAMPAVGLFIGLFLAYLATPLETRPDTTFISDAIAGTKPAPNRSQTAATPAD